jgi:phosphorylcholine metabolism protein LicD
MDHWTAVADELGIRWWADYGTLLGAVRNQGIIPHDKDADIGMMGEQWEAVLSYRPDIAWTKGKTTFRQEWKRKIDGYLWIMKEPREPQNRARYEYTGGHSIKILASEINRTNLDIFPWYPRTDPKLGDIYERRRYISIDRYKGRQFPGGKLLPLVDIEWEGRQIPAPADPRWFCRHRYGASWETPIRANNDGIRR